MCTCVCVCDRLQEEVDLMEDEMRRREEGGGEVLTDKDMEKAL